MDLTAGHSHAFIVTDHVADEVSDRYPDQQRRFEAAVKGGALSQESVTSHAEIALFGTLSASGRLGAGECSAIAVAVHRRHMLAIDDRRATIQAQRADRTLRILTTQNLMVSMIGEGLLDIVEADSIKDEWAARHRFQLKLATFRDVCPWRPRLVATALECSGLHAPDPRAERDVLIAATAIVHRMTVVTGNLADFGATGIALVDLWIAT